MTDGRSMAKPLKRIVDRTNEAGLPAPDHRVEQAHTPPKKGSHAVIPPPQGK